MTWASDLGRRVADARLARRLSVQAAAREAGIARDTWSRIEAGKSVQDTKRAIALALLDLDDHGRPRSPAGDRQAAGPDPAPVPPRLDEATLDELLDEIAVRRGDRTSRLPGLDEGRASRRQRLRADASPQERAAYDDRPDDSDDTDDTDDTD